jgi:aminomethyltransferase
MEKKKTSLYDWHKENGANMGLFGGYEMPLWYNSVKNEHISVLTNAGIFDTSHMAVVMVEGIEAFSLLQLCFTNDLSACIGSSKKALFREKCVYGAILDENGMVIDDAIIFYIKENSYMIVVNAGMGADISDHLKAYDKTKKVKITDYTDRLGKLDVQGPFSVKIMKKIIKNPMSVFEKMPYFSFKGHFDPKNPLSNQVKLIDNTPILLSRTGYTGELGFEIFVEKEDVIKLWEMILKAGAEFNITPCGLAARDSLRAGAVLPLSHQDIGHWLFINHPWEFALPFNDEKTGFTKPFIGDKALLASKKEEYTYPFLGNDLRKISGDEHEPAVVLDIHENEIGIVLTCATDMGIGKDGDRVYSIASPDKPENFKAKGLCCGFIKVNKKLQLNELIILKDKKRMIKVEIINDIRPDRTARIKIQT